MVTFARSASASDITHTAACAEEHEDNESVKRPDVDPCASALAPRVFVISQEGAGMELLHPSTYLQYVSMHQGRQGVTDTTDELPGAGVTLHRFVKELEEVRCTVRPMWVSEGATVGVPGQSHALSALKLPCNSFPRPTAGLLLPRVAAPTQPAEIPEIKPTLLLLKEFLIYASSEETIKKCLEVHSQCNEECKQPENTATDKDASKVCLPGIACVQGIAAISQWQYQGKGLMGSQTHKQSFMVHTMTQWRSEC